MGATWLDRLKGWLLLGPPVIEYGSQGQAVTNFQHLIGIQPADGSFGPITVEAAKSWQSAHGIEADGVIGPITWAAIANATPARISVDNAPASSGTGGMQPLPAGTKPLPQSVANNPAITAWAVELVHTPSLYPRGSITAKTFGNINALGRIEDHTWTHRNGKLVTGLNPPIRGASLYLAPASEVGFGADLPFAHSVTSVGYDARKLRKKGMPIP
jgi:peptidoglycan hydrolase-like protein with peptidoglycan-binding domain